MTGRPLGPARDALRAGLGALLLVALLLVTAAKVLLVVALNFAVWFLLVLAFRTLITTHVPEWAVTGLMIAGLTSCLLFALWGLLSLMSDVLRWAERRT